VTSVMSEMQNMLSICYIFNRPREFHYVLF